MKRPLIAYLHQETLTFFMMLIAIVTLFYGIHRASVNQTNVTTRMAGFQILKSSNELQTLIHTAHYDKPSENTHYKGWAKILLIGDMAFFMDKNVMLESTDLQKVWLTTNQHLNKKKQVADLLKRIQALKQSVRFSLQDIS